MRNATEHEVRVVGWTLDLARPMQVALDEDAYRLCESLDAALAVTGEPPPPEPPPVALVWRDAARSVRVVVLRSPGPPLVQLEGLTGRRIRVEQDPVVITLMSQSWARHPGTGWTLRAWGAATDTLALLTVASTQEGDGPWARDVVRSLRFVPPLDR